MGLNGVSEEDAPCLYFFKSHKPKKKKQKTVLYSVTEYSRVLGSVHRCREDKLNYFLSSVCIIIISKKFLWGSHCKVKSNKAELKTVHLKPLKKCDTDEYLSLFV